MVKYIVIDEWNNSTHDRFEEIFGAPEIANRFARLSWEHLTIFERERRHIFAAVIREEDLADDAKDEDTGEIDWLAWVNCHTAPDLFDSGRLQNA